MTGLTSVQRETCYRTGFVAPIPAFSAKDAAALRAEVEALKRDHAAGAEKQAGLHETKSEGSV